MFRILVISSIVFIFFCSLRAQDLSQYHFPEKYPESYKIDPVNEYLISLKNLQKNKDKSISDREKLQTEFSKEFVQFKSNQLNEGNIYLGWIELENYIKDIAIKVLPQEFTSDTSFRVYINTDPSNNAFAVFDNSIYVNIGLIADVEDEAEIAGTLAHEYGHLLGFHAFNRFVHFNRAKKSQFYNVYGIPSLVAAANLESKLIGQESDADNQILELLPKAGYSLNSTIKAFRKYELIKKRIELNGNYMLANSGWVTISTHPNSLDRALKISDFKKKTSYNGSKFIVSETLFYKLKQQAQLEQMRLLLMNGRYYSLIANAFEKYLLDTQNKEHIYYLLEAIRRWELIDAKITSVNFITQTPSNTSDDAILLNNLGPNYLSISSIELSKSNAKDLLDPSVIEFKTYGEAYDYFYRKSKAISCKECEFSKIMRDQFLGQTLDKSFLENYQKDSLVQFSNLAKYLLNGKTKDAYKNTIVINTVSSQLPQIADSVKIATENVRLRKIVSTYSMFSDTLIARNKSVRIILNSADFANHYADYLFFNQLASLKQILNHNQRFTIGKMLFVGYKNFIFGEDECKKINKIDLPLIMPEFAENCFKKGINNIHFIYQEIENIAGDFSKSPVLKLRMQYKSCDFNINYGEENIKLNKKLIDGEISKSNLLKLFRYDLNGDIPKNLDNVK